jgi:hypothetical protein
VVSIVDAETRVAVTARSPELRYHGLKQARPQPQNRGREAIRASAASHRAVQTKIPAAITIRLMPSPSRRLGGSRNIFKDTT